MLVLTENRNIALEGRLLGMGMETPRLGPEMVFLVQHQQEVHTVIP